MDHPTHCPSHNLEDNAAGNAARKELRLLCSVRTPSPRNLNFIQCIEIIKPYYQASLGYIDLLKEIFIPTDNAVHFQLLKKHPDPFYGVQNEVRNKFILESFPALCAPHPLQPPHTHHANTPPPPLPPPRACGCLAT